MSPIHHSRLSGGTSINRRKCRYQIEPLATQSYMPTLADEIGWGPDRAALEHIEISRGEVAQREDWQPDIAAVALVDTAEMPAIDASPPWTVGSLSARRSISARISQDPPVPWIKVRAMPSGLTSPV